MRSLDLQNKNVVITGASMGIGKQMAEAFDDAGANVLVVARSTDTLRAIADRINGGLLAADLSRVEGVDGLVGHCIETLGQSTSRSTATPEPSRSSPSPDRL